MRGLGSGKEKEKEEQGGRNMVEEGIVRREECAGQALTLQNHEESRKGGREREREEEPKKAAAPHGEQKGRKGKVGGGG